MKQICLECYSREEFLADMKQLFATSNNSVVEHLDISNDKLLTRVDAAEKLKISLATLNTWTRQGLLVAYKKGKRVYYKEQEMIDSLKRVDHQKYKMTSIKSSLK